MCTDSYWIVCAHVLIGQKNWQNGFKSTIFLSNILNLNVSVSNDSL